MIEHEDRLHKEEKINEMKKRAAEKENIQQIVFFLKSEETNFDKFRNSECHERKFQISDRQIVRQSPERIQKRISPKLQKKIKLPKIKVWWIIIYDSLNKLCATNFNFFTPVMELKCEKWLLKFDVVLSHYKLDHDKLNIIYILSK